MIVHQLKAKDLNADWEAQISVLFSQLTELRDPLPVREVLQQPNPPVIFLCTEGNRILGMGCMARYMVLSGNKGWIEDVVVAREARGRGIGRKLMNHLIDFGKSENLGEILLFTGKQRKPAIALYETLGFKRKNSHLLVLSLQEYKSQLP